MSTHRPLAQLVSSIQGGLARMREIVAEDLEGEDSRAVLDMTGHVARFEGKQLRGALVLLSGDATGNTTDEHPSVAAIVELIHLATLVHDDILDGAKVRRRVACVNQRWDNQVAVLLGDLLYARAFARSTALSSRLASRILADTTRAICVGEIDQSASRYDFEQTQGRYEHIAGQKTASLYAAACELGSRYPGGNLELGAALRQFGHELGLAFQIIDDLLDVTASDDQLGKSAGTDAEDGKVTLPILFTYAQAGAGLRARMREIYTAEEFAGRRARTLREEIDLCAGVAHTRARAETLVHSARARLERLPDSVSKQALMGIADFVLERSF